jgi:hypothetical protein
MVENLTYTPDEHLEETLQLNPIKSNMNAIVWKQVCVLGVLLALCSDCVPCWKDEMSPRGGVNRRFKNNYGIGLKECGIKLTFIFFKHKT